MQKLLAFQLFVFPLVAQAAPDAGARLDKIFERYQVLKDFSSEFQQTKALTREGLELKSQGTLRVSFGKALLWDVQKPGRLAVFLSPSTLEIRAGTPPSQTRNVYDLKSSATSEALVEGLKELTALLSMNRDEVAKAYTVAAGTSPDALMLTPKTPRQFARVHLSEGQGGGWIARIDIDEVSGDRLRLDLAAPTRGDSHWIDTWQAAPQ